MKLETAFVTGATGHIGSTLCRALADAGVTVRALVRPTSDRAALSGVDVEIVPGDVLEPASLRRGATGADVVFHLAAVFDLHPHDPVLAARVALEGTRNALAAAGAAGARVVLASSVAAAGYADGPSELLDEESWAEGLRVPYYQLKLAQEREALRAAADLGVDLVRILPTLVLGPGDARITPSTRFLLDMALGRGATFDGGLNVVDVRDLATALVFAARHAAPGDRFIVGSDNILLRDFGAEVASRSGRAVRHVTLPRWAMTMLAATMELGASLGGGRPAVTRDLVRDVYGRFAWYDVSRAKERLGLTPRPLGDTIADALDDLARRGLVELPAPGAKEAA